MKNADIKQVTVTTEEPNGPILRPNKPALKEPINGKKINNKYIKFFLKSSFGLFTYIK